MEIWQIVIAATAVIFVVFAAVFLLRRKLTKKAKELPEKRTPAQVLTSDRAPAAELAPLKGPAPVAKTPVGLEGKLAKSRSSLFGRLEKFFTRDQINPKEWEELEEILIEADVGVSTSRMILSRVREAFDRKSGAELKHLVGEQCREILKAVEPKTLDLETVPKPWVISIVGVNGVGKTTTIGKLTRHFVHSGKTVLLGAADTFRAGAINQLKIWAEREGAQFVSGREGGDPGAVAFDALSAAKAREIDVVILDTAGRLHTKTSLMDELKKVHRVMKKVIPEAPHETWIVVDGNLGQNSVAQAREFQKALDLTGLVVTKLDGTAKGGAILGIASELGLPVRFIGVGESSEDFLPFQAENFVKAIISG